MMYLFTAQRCRVPNHVGKIVEAKRMVASPIHRHVRRHVADRELGCGGEHCVTSLSIVDSHNVGSVAHHLLR